MNLSVDQQRLINMYVTQYNQTNAHIERLMDTLDDIRNNIQSVVLGNNNYYSRQNRSNRFNRSNYRYTNTNNSSSTNYLNTYINNLLNNRNTSTNNVFPINETAYTRLFNRYPNNDNNNNNTNSFFNNFLNSTVPVRPTMEQIDRATHSVRYGDIPNPVSLSCPISLETFNDNDIVRQIRHCEHVFSESQITQWFNTNVRCPVCRYDIRNYVANDTTNNNINTNEPNDHLEEEPRSESPPTPIPMTNSVPNIVRNPITNQIEHLSFDITGSSLANNLLQNFTNQMFQTLLGGSTTDSIYDASNNMFWDISHNIFVDPSFNTILFEAIAGSFNNNI